MKKNKLKIVLQARVSSYRLYGKVLLPISNIPMSVLCAKRLSNTGYPTIVAIPKQDSDDSLELVLKKNNIKIFRGSHKNVLKRYIEATKDMDDDDLIIRATADNPLPDGNFVSEALKIFLKSKSNFINTHNKFFNLPYGLALQVFYVKNLRLIYKQKPTKTDCEHVVPILDRNNNFIKNLNKYNKYKKYYTKEKLSVDNFDDYLRVEKLFRQVKDPINEKWYKIINKGFKRK